MNRYTALAAIAVFLSLAAVALYNSVSPSITTETLSGDLSVDANAQTPSVNDQGLNLQDHCSGIFADSPTPDDATKSEAVFRELARTHSLHEFDKLMLDAGARRLTEPMIAKGIKPTTYHYFSPPWPGTMRMDNYIEKLRNENRGCHLQIKTHHNVPTGHWSIRAETENDTFEFSGKPGPGFDPQQLNLADYCGGIFSGRFTEYAQKDDPKLRFAKDTRDTLDSLEVFEFLVRTHTLEQFADLMTKAGAIELGPIDSGTSRKRLTYLFFSPPLPSGVKPIDHMNTLHESEDGCYLTFPIILNEETGRWQLTGSLSFGDYQWSIPGKLK